MTVASPTAVASTGKEFVAQPDQQSKQNDADERTAGNQFFLHVHEWFRLHLQKSDTNGKSFLTEDQYVQESERAGAGNGSSPKTASPETGRGDEGMCLA